MIVNVNPFDTGFEENTSVMQFSAIAAGVSTVTKSFLPVPKKPATAVRQVTLSIPTIAGKATKRTKSLLVFAFSHLPWMLYFSQILSEKHC